MTGGGEPRVVVVTGAARGIGLVYARAFLDAGYPVAFTDVVSDVDEIAANEAQGRGAVGLMMDVSDEASVRTAVQTISSELGPPLVLVNNAALFSQLDFVDWSDIDVGLWDRVMAINVRGPFICAKECLPWMIAAGWGRIINISSTTYLVGSYRRLHYATSKSAVVGFTRALAREVGASGVTVNAIAPGSTESTSVVERYPREIFEMSAKARAIPRGQMPEDLVGTVLFLASDASAFITGQTIVVDGGHAFL